MPDKEFSDIPGGIGKVLKSGPEGLPTVNEIEEYLKKNGWEEAYSKSGKYLGYFKGGRLPIQVLTIIQAFIQQRDIDSPRPRKVELGA